MVYLSVSLHRSCTLKTVHILQQDVIGQNLVDITHPDSAAEISDCLKPSVVSSTSMYMAQECAYIVSQFRQFFVKFKSSLANSRFITHTVRFLPFSLPSFFPSLFSSPSHTLSLCSYTVQLKFSQSKLFVGRASTS